MGGGIGGGVVCEMLTMPALAVCLRIFRCKNGHWEKSINSTCWETEHLLYCGIGLIVILIMLPLSLYFASEKNSIGNPPFYFFPYFNIILVALKYCTSVVASQNAWGEAGGFNSILLFGLSCSLVALHYHYQPCMGGPIAHHINDFRQMSFTVAAWASFVRVCAVFHCTYGNCDDSWWYWPFIFVGGVPFVAFAAWYFNNQKSLHAQENDSHTALLFGDAIKGNMAVAMGKNALCLTEDSEDRGHAIDLISHMKKSKRNPGAFEVDLFKNATPKDLNKMLVVADPHVIYLGCEMLYRLYMYSHGPKGLEMDHPHRVKLIELDAPRRLYGFINPNAKDVRGVVGGGYFPDEDLRLAALRACTILGFYDTETISGDVAIPDHIDMSRTEIGDDDVMGLLNYSTLRSINLSSTSAATSPMLARLTQLTDLKIRNTNHLRDKGLIRLTKSLSNLRSLDLHGCGGLHERGIASLGSLTELRELTLSYGLFSDVGLTHAGGISELANLESLDISGCSKLTDEACRLISTRNKSLKTLKIALCRFTDSAIKKTLRSLPQLETLDVSGVAMFNDSCIETLSGMDVTPRLKGLFMNGCESVSDFGLGALTRGCQNLEVLALGGCRNVTFRGVDFVDKCPLLKRIRADQTNAGDMGVTNWAGLNQLETVDLSRTNIGDDAVKALIESESLVELKLKYCDNVSKVGMELWTKKKKKITAKQNEALDEKIQNFDGVVLNTGDGENVKYNKIKRHSRSNSIEPPPTDGTGASPVAIRAAAAQSRVGDEVMHHVLREVKSDLKEEEKEIDKMDDPKGKQGAVGQLPGQPSS